MSFSNVSVNTHPKFCREMQASVRKLMYREKKVISARKFYFKLYGTSKNPPTVKFCAMDARPMRLPAAVPGGARAPAGACALRDPSPARRENSSLSQKPTQYDRGGEARRRFHIRNDRRVDFALLVGSGPRFSHRRTRGSFAAGARISKGAGYHCAARCVRRKRGVSRERVRGRDRSRGRAGWSEGDGRRSAASRKCDGKVGGTSKAVESVVATCGYPPVVTRTFAAGSRR